MSNIIIINKKAIFRLAFIIISHIFCFPLFRYINAISGIRPEQMAKITEPIQIGDLIVLPEYGYNPPRNSASNPWSVSRVVHLFRGSWKDTVITNTQSS